MTHPSPDDLPADPRDGLFPERLAEQERRLAAQAEQIAALEAMVADLRDRALRSMIRVWHAALEQGLPAVPAGILKPLEHEFRHAVLAGLASVPRVPGPKYSTKQKPGRELLEFCRDRRDDVLRFTTDTSIWPANISERGVRPLKPSRRSPAA